MPAPKQILAGALLTGVAAIWVPRLTGMNVPWLPSQDGPARDAYPSSSEVIPRSGSDSSSADKDEEISMEALEGVVDFLDQRGGPTGSQGSDGNPEAGAETDDTAASVGVSEPEAPSYTTSLEPLFGPLRDDEDEGPTWQEQVEEFNREHPLHTVIEGNGKATATFGFQRVQVGDRLMNGLLQVESIDAKGVSFSSEEGPVRILMPPLGATSFTEDPPFPEVQTTRKDR